MPLFATSVHTPMRSRIGRIRPMGDAAQAIARICDQRQQGRDPRSDVRELSNGANGNWGLREAPDAVGSDLEPPRCRIGV